MLAHQDDMWYNNCEMVVERDGRWIESQRWTNHKRNIRFKLYYCFLKHVNTFIYTLAVYAECKIRSSFVKQIN